MVEDPKHANSNGGDSLDLRYQRLVEGWAKRTVDAAWWGPVTSACFSTRLIQHESDLLAAHNAVHWIAGRRWPKARLSIDEELRRFGLVLKDLVQLLDNLLESREGAEGLLWFAPFYKVVSWPQSDRLHDEYDWPGDLASDLALELGRAANSLCDRVAASFDPLFRDHSGLVRVQSLDMLNGTTTYYAQYSSSDVRYKSLRHFIDARSTRDHSVGTGMNEEAKARAGLEGHHDYF